MNLKGGCLMRVDAGICWRLSWQPEHCWRARRATGVCGEPAEASERADLFHRDIRGRSHPGTERPLADDPACCGHPLRGHGVRACRDLQRTVTVTRPNEGSDHVCRQEGERVEIDALLPRVLDHCRSITIRGFRSERLPQGRRPEAYGDWTASGSPPNGYGIFENNRSRTACTLMVRSHLGEILRRPREAIGSREPRP